MTYLIAALIVLGVAFLFAAVWLVDRRANEIAEAEEPPPEWDWPIATTQGRKLERDDG